MDVVGIKEMEDKIFNFLEVDENWNEWYFEGGYIVDCINFMFCLMMIFKYLYVVGLLLVLVFLVLLYGWFLFSFVWWNDEFW